MKKFTLKNIKPYWQAPPDIFQFQIVSKWCIAVCLFFINMVFSLLLKSAGRVALSSGDDCFRNSRHPEYLHPARRGSGWNECEICRKAVQTDDPEKLEKLRENMLINSTMALRGSWF